ncbi:hypothetical protein SUNI508_08499 [Seiridium unicorne]|uniref:Arca-like protein n=1 Tax=Seiridium unicorne TaxID=138068 RepID=A0ABR2UTT1_9PEZI
MSSLEDNGSSETPRDTAISHLSPQSRHSASSSVGTPTTSRKPETGSQRSYRVRFRHTLNPSVTPQRPSEDKRDYVFAADQRWVRAPRSFNFVDETQEIISIHEAETSDTELEDAASARLETIDERYASYERFEPASTATAASSAGRPKRLAEFELPRRKRTLSSHSSIGASSTSEINDLLADSSIGAQAIRPSDAVSSPPMVHSNAPGLHQLLNASVLLDSPSYEPVFEVSPLTHTGCVPFFTNEEQQPLSSFQLEQPRWPLKDCEEAFLFQYFVREIAPLFDLCDNLRHFAKVVPKRAPFCPPLLNAMLATSAKRLSRIGNMDTLTVDRYYQECLRSLIPSLSSETAVQDENLLAATVILRYMEETDVAFSASGSQSHHIGTRVFLAAQENNDEFSGLRLASFWIALRQEIFMAFIHSRPVHASLLSKNIAPVLEGSGDECSYANKVILHCAYCIQFCFGSQEQRPSVWNELSNYLDQWNDNKPWCFESMSPEEADDARFLPEIIYVSDEVLTGMQHYYLGRLVLEAHNPDTPRLGPARRLALDGVNEKLKKLVRIICGISESNTQHAPAYVNAAVSIVMAGDRFIERQEQEALYRILVKIEKEMAWPTGAAQIDLKNAWGWSKTPDMSIAGILNENAGIVV